MTLLAITTVFRTVLIIIGVFVVLRVVGQMMVAKRNLDAEKELLRKQREEEKVASESRKNFGKTTVSNIDKKSISDNDYTEFEEVK